MDREPSTVYPLALPRAGRARPAFSVLGKLVPIAGLLLAMPFAMQTVSGQRALLAAGIFLCLFTTYRTGLGIVMALGYLAFLGGLRRQLIPVLGWPDNDVLLLVCPILGMLFFLSKAFSRKLPRDTRLSRLMLWLLFVMGAQIFNPQQGDITVGLAGALFYIVPLLWYYIGRDLVTPTLLQKIFQVVVVIAILAALYGLRQAVFGFNSVEEEWLRITGYTALRVGDSLRPISFFTSSAEYVQFLSIAMVLLWAMWLRGNFAALLPMPLLAVAMVFSGVRGPIVFTIVGCTLLWAVQGRTRMSWAPRIALAICLAGAGLIWSLNQVQTANMQSQASSLVQHQTQGLLDPLNEKHSTAGLHANLVTSGLQAGVTNPLGSGLGTTTMAGSRFGGATASTEVDVSDMFVSLGLIGGLLYVATLCVIITTSLRRWHLSRHPPALSVLGILFVTLGQWLNGGQYSIAMLAWICIGALDGTPEETAR